MHRARIRRTLIGMLMLAGGAAATGCSAASLTGTSTPQGLSQSQVNAFMGQVANAFSNGMAGANAQRTPASVVRDVNYRSATGFPSPLATLVNVSVSQRTNCTAGGYINVTGSLTGSIDTTGTGVLQTQVDETINSWQCIGAYVINGDPYLSAAGTFSFLNGQQATAASISFGGGFQWSGASSGSCSIQMTMLFEPDGSGTLSGTACGYNVLITF